MPAPLCRFCGTPIKKVSCTVYVREGERQTYETDSSMSRYVYPAERPKTIADCAKLTNDQILSVRYKTTWDGDVEKSTGFIGIFTTWDGKSYVDDYFCNGNHARLFGYAAARAGHVMAAWQIAKSNQEKDHVQKD